MADVLDAVSWWIYGTLKNDSTIVYLVNQLWGKDQTPSVVTSRTDEWIFESEAPAQTSTPYILFDPISAVDNTANFANRVNTNAIYQIRVVGAGNSYSDLSVIYTQVDTLLAGVKQQVVTANSGNVLIGSCIRSNAFKRMDNVDTVRYRCVGGLYRIVLSNSY